MPALVVPSPVMLDHSFPRDQNELRVVCVAFGELEAAVTRGDFRVLLTRVLQEFVAEFDWQRFDETGTLRELYRLLNQWFLQPHEALVLLHILETQCHQPHPVPANCQLDGLVEFWADELGSVLVLHDGCCEMGRFFIGIACPYAFAGLDKSSYAAQLEARRFPIVGPTDIRQLDDAYTWDVPHDAHRWEVSFTAAKKNCFAIGAGEVVKPSGGSHHRVTFNGARTWVLDPNDDPVPDAYLNQLVPITGYPLDVVKFALVSGHLPPRVFRLRNYL